MVVARSQSADPVYARQHSFRDILPAKFNAWSICLNPHQRIDLSTGPLTDRLQGSRTTNMQAWHAQKRPAARYHEETHPAILNLRKVFEQSLPAP